MSDDKSAPREHETRPLVLLLKRLWDMTRYRWGVKLLSLVLAIVLWGGLISQDANLTREKVFKDVVVSVINSDSLQRNGLIVTSGLADLAHVTMRAEVPQRMYNNVTANNYNLRIDLSRITQAGEQQVPLMYTSTTTYGTVSYLSQTEVTVFVDEYITRRRIPVQINTANAAPAGFYAKAATVDPASVTVSGPKAVVDGIAMVKAQFDLSTLEAAAGVQLRAVPFTLYDRFNQTVSSKYISVTSEGVLLDTLLVEQWLYPVKAININLTAATKGKPAAGFEVSQIIAEPSALEVAATSDVLESLKWLDPVGAIDINGANGTFIRAVKSQTPAEAIYMSEATVYVTVVLKPAAQRVGKTP